MEEKTVTLYLARTFAESPRAHITRGEFYPVSSLEDSASSSNRYFEVVADSGIVVPCTELGCAYLDGGDWELFKVEVQLSELNRMPKKR